MKPFLPVFAAILIGFAALAQNNVQMLHEALSNRQYRTVDSLIKTGTDPNSVWKFETLLTRSVRSCSLPDTLLISYFVKHGADPNKAGNDISGTPLAIVGSSQFCNYRIPIMETLYRYGARVNVDSGPQPISAAITYQSYDAVLWLLRHGAKVEPGYLASVLEGINLTREKDARSIDAVLADTLISLTRLPGGGNRYLLTALGTGIKNGDVVLVKKLLEKEPGLLQKKRPEGRGAAFYPFLLAAYKWVGDPYQPEHLQILKLLVEKGADVQVTMARDFKQSVTHYKNPDIPKGANALDVAILSGASKEAIDYLRSLGLKETPKTGE